MYTTPPHTPTPTQVPRDTQALEDALSAPSQALIDMFGQRPGDILVLGAAGKMGPTLARMAQRATQQAGNGARVIGVSRFSDPAEKSKLEAWGIETIQGDLLDASFVQSLPDAPHVVYMAGMKFGATGKESLTWAMNSLLPARICERFAGQTIAAFSTGNVYGLTPVMRGGSIESDPLNPQGEYAMSCLGRERTFEHYSRTNGTRVSLLRLNYACDLRYGVLVDLAQRIYRNEPVDLCMPAFNIIWQRDANEMALRSLADADSPPNVLNIAGPEQLSVRRVCRQLANLLDRPAMFTGEEQTEAILSNGQKGHRRYGYPTVAADLLIEWVAQWLKQGGELLGKPTKYEARDGKF